jgi:hypothetical protein
MSLFSGLGSKVQVGDTLSNGFVVQIEELRQHLNSSFFLNAKITVFHDKTKQKIHSRFIRIHLDNSHRWRIEKLNDDLNFDTCFVYHQPKNNYNSNSVKKPIKTTISTEGGFMAVGTTEIGSGSGYGDDSSVMNLLEKFFGGDSMEVDEDY